MKARARRLGWILTCVAGVLAAGCGGNKATVGVTVTPSTATVRVTSTQQFTATASNGGAVNWSVNGTMSGNSTVGTIDSNGLYTAPSTVPPSTTITVTATLQSDSAVSGSATVTLDSGIRVTITPTSFTLGTGETFNFSAIVTGISPTASGTSCGPPPSSVLCTAVTWSVTPTTGAGTISPNGTYTAPGTATTAVITATSVFDASRATSATVSVVTATPPTLSSISPNTAPRGALFQDVYLTGANFLSTTNVFVTDPIRGTIQVPPTNIVVPSPGITTAPSTAGTLIHVRLPDIFLTAPPTPPAVSAPLLFAVSQQNAAPVNCISSPSMCLQLSLVPVRPVLVGTSPDSIPQATGSGVSFNVNGGFFGTSLNPTVSTQFAGSTKLSSISTANSTRQLSVTIGGSGNGSDVATPGLFPVSVTSNVNPGLSAVANVAIQPSYPASTINHLATLSPLAGAAPAAVAINPATGIALVANQGTNDLMLIDLTNPTPSIVGFLCTGASGQTLTPTESASCPVSGPVSVAVDDILNVALVANLAGDNIAVVDLNQSPQKVTALLPVPTNNAFSPPISFVPVAVGVNPIIHRAVVAYRSTNVASLIDLNQAPAVTPSFVGVVNVSTGPNARVAVSPRLNWALITPGGLGSLSAVDLSRQSTNSIAAPSSSAPGVTCTSGTVTVTTTATHALQLGEPVLISGVPPVTVNSVTSNFNGIFSVASVPSSTTFTYTQPAAGACTSTATSGGGTISYALPVFTSNVLLTVQGVAINDETQKAVLTDPSGSTFGTVFNMLDQTSASIPVPSANQGDANNNLAVAVNPLANLVVTANQSTGNAYLIDPSGLGVLTSLPGVGTKPVDVAIDPVTNIAVFVNQGPPANISIYSLSSLRPLQILQSSISPVSDAACPSSSGPIISGTSFLICSTLSAPTSNSSQPVFTILGSGFTSNTAVRLDGQTIPKTFVSSRKLTATLPAGFASSARRYALDVADSGVLSNVNSFAIVQSVNVRGVSSNCNSPAPQGVAVDSQLNKAVVSDSGLGCNQVYVIDLATGTGGAVSVDANPQGVAVFPRLGVALVANQASNTVSVVDEVGKSVVATVTTDSAPTGVAVDTDLNSVVVTAAGGAVADQFSLTKTSSSVTAGSTSALTVQSQPTAIAVDSLSHFAAVGNAVSNSVTVLNLLQAGSTNTAVGIQIPQGIAVDPVPFPAQFLITVSSQNQVEVLDPGTGNTSFLKVGINPTALSYNFLGSTLVTLNSASQTMTVIDYLDRRVRAVFPVTPSTEFGVAIQPQSNLAVVADSTNSRILLLPLPH